MKEMLLISTVAMLSNEGNGGGCRAHEICGATGYSRSSVSRGLRQAIDEGYLTKICYGRYGVNLSDTRMYHIMLAMISDEDIIAMYHDMMSAKAMQRYG